MGGECYKQAQTCTDSYHINIFATLIDTDVHTDTPSFILCIEQYILTYVFSHKPKNTKTDQNIFDLSVIETHPKCLRISYLQIQNIEMHDKWVNDHNSH